MKKILPAAIIALALVAFSPTITKAVSSFFYVGDNGYISVGNSDPQAPLDVSGAIYSRLVTATSTTIDWNKGNVQTMTLGSSPTLTFTNAQAGGEYKLILKQDGSGGRTVTWPSNIKWPGGMDPVLTSSPNGIDVLGFISEGATYLGSAELGLSSTSTLINSLVSYWKFDGSSGDATDSVGSNTLTNYNSVSYVPGLINNGSDFGSANTDKSFYIASNLGINGGPVSISSWVKLNTELTANDYTLIDLFDSSDHTEYDLTYDYNGGSRRIIIDRGRNCVSDNSIFYPITLGTSSWHHLVTTFDGSTLTLYVDGTNAGTLATSGSGGCSATWGFSVGSHHNVDSFASAKIDEVGVWNRALTSSEVTELYNSDYGIQYPF